MYFQVKNTLKSNYNHTPKLPQSHILMYFKLEIVMVIAVQRVFSLEIHQNNIFYFLKIIFEISTKNNNF